MLTITDLLGIALIILLVQVVMLWEVLKWLKLIGEKFGCSPRRTKRIAKLLRKLDYDQPYKLFPHKLSDEKRKKLDEEFKELCDFETCYGPATGGQMIALLKRFDEAKKS